MGVNTKGRRTRGILHAPSVSRTAHCGVLASLVLAALVACVGCASTEIVSQWSNPAYSSPFFKKIIVIGISRQTSIRRTFEDDFVSQLKAAGYNAVPSYDYIPEGGPVGESRLRRAVRESGADAAIITRLIRVEERRQVTPGYYQPIHPFGFYGWYSSAWAGYYEPPRVYHYAVYTSETSLYDMKKNRVVWSGTVETTAPGNIGKEIRSYIKIVISALENKKLL
jgi:hypothetical protein